MFLLGMFWKRTRVAVLSELYFDFTGNFLTVLQLDILEKKTWLYTALAYEKIGERYHRKL